MTLEDLAQAEYERLTLTRMDRAGIRAQQVNPRHPGASAGHNDRLIRVCLELLRDEDRLDANRAAREQHNARRINQNIRFLDQHSPSLVGNGATAMPSPSVAPTYPERKVA